MRDDAIFYDVTETEGKQVIDCQRLKKRTVGARVNVVGELGNLDLETPLDLLQNLSVRGRRDESDRETLGTETTSTTRGLTGD